MSKYVFLHGINNSPRSWENVLSEFDAPNTIAPLLPPLESVEEIVASLLSELPDEFFLIGHSFGGYVSLAILEEVPERIKGLILVNTLDNADTPEAAANRKNRAREALDGKYTELAQSATNATYHPDNLDSEKLMQERAEAIAEYGAERFAAHQIASSRRKDRSDVLQKASVPILVIAAAEDKVIATSRQKEMAERVSAEFITIDGGGHMLPAEQPKKLADAIKKWAERP